MAIRHPDDRDGRQRRRDVERCGRRHQRAARAAGTASGAMGFLQQGIGSLLSQFGAYLGGNSTTTLPLTAAIFALSIACASAMFFLVPRGDGDDQRGTDREGGGGREWG